MGRGGGFDIDDIAVAFLFTWEDTWGLAGRNC